jgi:hypothetical protein
MRPHTKLKAWLEGLHGSMPMPNARYDPIRTNDDKLRCISLEALFRKPLRRSIL